MAPEDIGLAVSIEVADSHDLPIQVTYSSWRGLGRDGGPIHQPDIKLARDRMAPENIGFTVSVEVTDSHDLPIQVTDGSWGGLGRNGSSIHQPEINLA